jgi:hypothetical protein
MFCDIKQLHKDVNENDGNSCGYPCGDTQARAARSRIRRCFMFIGFNRLTNQCKFGPRCHWNIR